MVIDAPRQLWPEDKFQFSPFSYAKAIIKDDVTYPIVPNCPIINVNNPATFDASNIPVGTFFIMHQQNWDSRNEYLCLGVPDDTTRVSGPGFIITTGRSNSTINLE